MSPTQQERAEAALARVLYYTAISLEEPWLGTMNERKGES